MNKSVLNSVKRSYIFHFYLNVEHQFNKLVHSTTQTLESFFMIYLALSPLLYVVYDFCIQKKFLDLKLFAFLLFYS